MRTTSGVDHLALRSLVVALVLAIPVIPAEASRVLFADQALIGMMQVPVSVFAADIDKDGDTDALAASVSSAGFLEPSLILYVNDGDPDHPFRSQNVCGTGGYGTPNRDSTANSSGSKCN